LNLTTKKTTLHARKPSDKTEWERKWFWIVSIYKRVITSKPVGLLLNRGLS